jgi:hypothetical protein
VASTAAASTACGGDTPFAAVRNFLDRVIRTSVRLGAEAPAVSEGLAGLGLQEPIARDVVSAVRAKGADLERAYAASAPRLPSVSGLRWRVDVTISSSSLNRVMRPTLLMEMTLSDGRVEAMEVPVERFHELRYSAAKLLAEMGVVAGHPVLRIQ